MRIRLNGEPKDIDEGTSVSGLLSTLGIKTERVAVEVNLDIVRRDQREARILVDGDTVEIVSFVGGGK